MPWTPQDIDDNDTSALHGQAYYLKTEDENGDQLSTVAEKLHCNVAVPELDDDGVSYRRKKRTGNVNDILTAAGLTGAQRQAFLDGLKAVAAWCKAEP